MIFSFWQEHLDEFLDSMCEQGFCTKVISAHKRFTPGQLGRPWKRTAPGSGSVFHYQ